MPGNASPAGAFGLYAVAMVWDGNAAARAADAIDAAFGGLAPPDDDALLHPQCMDDGDIADFYGRPDVDAWPDERVIRNYAAPSFFSAAAFRYYMPAFMRWSLAHPDSVEYVVESTLRAFDPGPEGARLRDFQLSKFALFDAAQRRAVVGFLEVFAAHADLGPVAAAALANHWRAPAREGD